MAESKPFIPAFWLKNPHLQTFWPFLFRFNPKPNYQRERIKLPDSDFINLDHVKRSSATPVKALVLLVHGLQGSSRSHYIRGMAQTLSNADYKVIVMNRRALYGHGAHTDDIDFIARSLKSANEGLNLNVISASLGSSMMLNWLAKTDDIASLVNSAVAISAPFSLASCAKRMEQGISKVYQHYLVSSLKAAAKAQLTQTQLKKVLPNWTHSKTFYEFDDAVTARLHGYRDADDYYEKASTITKLKNIKIPLLLIQSCDDPFMSDDVIPTIDQLHANTNMEAYESGGHVGFVAADGWKPYYWLDKRVLNFIEQNQD